MRKMLSMLLALILLVGCETGGSLPGGSGVEPIGEETVALVDLFPTQRAAEHEAGYAGFALELLRQSRVEGENTLVSPLSVTLALGMTSAGAAGDTAQQFADLMGVERGALCAYCLALMEDYSKLGGSTETNLVNSLWCDPDLTLNDPFIATCQSYFDAALFHADLQSPDTVKAVNDWVNDATRGKIPKVVEQFDDQAALALINAVYFKNQFQNPFITPSWEWTISFQNADGTVGKPQGMSNGVREELYLTHDKGQGVVMPYDDGRLGLLLMLPDEGVSLTDYLGGWDGATIATLLENQGETRISLRVPKFKAEWDGELADTLKAMGLADAFDSDRADFTPMGHSENGPLYIGQVIHKTAFEVNEKGTEAAAVTAVVAYAGCAEPPDNLVFDRPFVYGIVDLATGAPLFLGTVEHLD